MGEDPPEVMEPGHCGAGTWTPAAGAGSRLGAEAAGGGGVGSGSGQPPVVSPP